MSKNFRVFPSVNKITCFNLSKQKTQIQFWSKLKILLLYSLFQTLKFFLWNCAILESLKIKRQVTILKSVQNSYYPIPFSLLMFQRFITYYFSFQKKGLPWSWSYDNWIYNYLCNQCLSPLTLWVQIPHRRVLYTTLCDKVCQWLAAGLWFSLGTLVSDIIEIIWMWRWFDLIWFLVFNTTFSNISTISWRPVLVVEEAGVPGENHRPWASNW